YKESADWGAVIRNVSEQKVNREIEKADFNEQFADGDDAQVIFGLNPNPKISAVAYHVSPQDWTPQRAQGLDGRRETLQYISINEQTDTVIAVTRLETLLGRAQTEELVDTNGNLYIAVSNKAQEPLFIPTSGVYHQAARFITLVANDPPLLNG
ncbi:restriction endonuclease subunit R, partial [Klebsiella pneumoniae]|uniref:hypothetical protein n=1 Tax=Klebsiella pneumoniae TaxID=573 RepID=UPI000E037D80